MRRAVILTLVAFLPALVHGQTLPAAYPPPIDRGRYYLEFTPIDSTDLQEPSPPDSVSPADLPFVTPPDDSIDLGGVWKIELTEGNPNVTGDETVYVDPKAHSFTQYVSFSLLDYYPKQELLLFESHQNEYKRYFVISRGDGEVSLAFGPPVFSPNRKWFITLSGYSISGWRPQGIQLFAVGEGWINEIVRFRTKGIKFRTGLMARNTFMGAPTRCEWMDESTFRLEMRQGIDTIESDPSYKYYRVDIRETGE